jgi:hypothetical protein
MCFLLALLHLDKLERAIIKGILLANNRNSSDIISLFKLITIIGIYQSHLQMRKLLLKS